MKKKIFGLLFGIVLLGLSSITLAACDKSGEEENSFGICVCQKGYTRVNGICTSCNGKDVCCGIKLNTDVPFIGTCITLKKQDPTATYNMVTEETAFPTMIGGLTKILMTVILIVCFLVIIYAGILIASSGGDTKRKSEGMTLIKGVAIAIALLGVSGIVLRLVNPNFFG